MCSCRSPARSRSYSSSPRSERIASSGLAESSRASRRRWRMSCAWRARNCASATALPGGGDVAGTERSSDSVIGTGYCGTDRARVMLSTILQTIRRHALLVTGDKVLVGVSGGPDSMALLAALWELAPRLRLTLEVATVDHGLRPVAGEVALVRERAEALGLPWHRLSVDVRGAGISRGLQEAARRARLGALAKLAQAQGCRRVALARQADDQEETVLLRILRGTGLRGLAGFFFFCVSFFCLLLVVCRALFLVFLFWCC